jgi:hypothetical protein
MKAIPKKRRSGDAAALGVTAIEARYSPETQTGYYVKQERRVSPAASKKNAKVAGNASWVDYKAWAAEKVEESFHPETGKFLSVPIDMGNDLLEDDPQNLAPRLSKARKYANEYFFRHHYGAAAEDAWDEFDGAALLPSIIMKHLAMPPGSYAAVVAAMKEILAAEAAEEAYDPSARIIKGRGAKPKIVDMTPQAEHVYRAMESGMSLGNTLVLLNQWRRVNIGPDGMISYGSLQRFAATSTVLEPLRAHAGTHRRRHFKLARGRAKDRGRQRNRGARPRLPVGPPRAAHRRQKER